MSDHNIWPNTTYDDPLAARAWLLALGFQEGTLVLDDAGGVRHSEMLWPEGGRVMVSERSDPPGEFDAPRGSAAPYVVVDDPVAVWDRAVSLQAPVLRPMQDTDYGSRGFTIRDPEGNSWSFGTYAG